MPLVVSSIRGENDAVCLLSVGFGGTSSIIRLIQWLTKMSLCCIYANLFLLLGGTTIGWPFALKSDKQVVPLGGGLCSNFGARWERGV